jgi:hypothetical protein
LFAIVASFHEVPFQTKASLRLVFPLESSQYVPTAEHDVAAKQLTPYSSSPLDPPRPGLELIDQDDPFQVSVRVRYVAWSPVVVNLKPTAAQNEGPVHDTLFSLLRVGRGKVTFGTRLHALPFHSSLRPVTVVEVCWVPMAMHQVGEADVQEMPLRMSSVLTKMGGVGTADHWLPFQTSEDGCALSLASSCWPTATQLVVLWHETAWSCSCAWPVGRFTV